MSEFSYQQISEALERLDIPADAAECQGAISAVICMTGDAGMLPWMSSHFPEIDEGVAEGNALASETRQQIIALYQEVAKQLNNGDFGYELLMPDEDAAINERTQSMSHWCQGFLLGLQYSGVSDINTFSGDLAEILQDITEISQVSGEGLENTEEEEQSYTELVEYLRVGVMLLYETLQAQRGNSQSTTLH